VFRGITFQQLFGLLTVPVIEPKNGDRFYSWGIIAKSEPHIVTVAIGNNHFCSIRFGRRRGGTM